MIAVERLLEPQVAVAERRSLQLLGFEKLVLHDIGVAEEVEDRSPVLRPELAEFQPLVFPAEQPGEAVLVQDIEVAELGHVVLEQPEAVGVDRADEHGTEPV